MTHGPFQVSALVDLAGPEHPAFGAFAFFDQPWVEDALCAQTDPEVFFPEKGGSTREAKAVCAACFVAAECLDYALTAGERFGIWGGSSERERRKLTGTTAHTQRVTNPRLPERTPPVPTITVLLIPADPDQPITWLDIDWGLEAFQHLVGGQVQVVPLNVPGTNLWCNEDTTGLNLATNARATTLYHEAGGMPGVDVLGDTFVTGRADADGETLGVTFAQAQLLLPEAPPS